MQVQGKPQLLFAAGETTPPTSFKLFSGGRNPTMKGDIVVDAAGNASVMERFNKHGADLPIDVGHGMLVGLLPEMHHAYGWFRPEVRGEDLWASSVEWTDRGRKALLAREFRYFSPAILMDDQRRLVGLVNVALTNLPATEKQAPLVAAQLSATTSLSIADQEVARTLLQQMAAPLSADERNVCRLMGLPESEFLDQRNMELRAKLPGWHAGSEHGLDKEEAHVAGLLGMSLADYAAQKAADAEQRQKRQAG